MVYVIGFIGFILGFIAGQGLLFFMLRNVSNEDLLEDKYLKLKYGILNWLIAAGGAYYAVFIYEHYNF
tara:strand:+ start:561 stop:764 length:204 start_codon:yes stop_codon:yes gene_type:complete